jgi:hypothetical protein
MLPTFVVIGAMKAATTSLYEYLRFHPQIYFPELKETNYFLEEGNWSRGLAWYRSLYEGAGRDGVVHAGDVSPGYAAFPIFAGAPTRMASLLPDAKIIYMLREPVARMRSHYLQDVADGHQTRPARIALVRDFRYLALSMYAMQLERYLEHFDHTQILVLRAEDLAAEPQATLDRVLTFLGLEPGWSSPGLGDFYNTSAAKRCPRSAVAFVQSALRRTGRVGDSFRLNKFALAHQLLSRPLAAGEAEPGDEIVGHLRRCLAPDAARLRVLVGTDFDPWDLA